MSFAILDTRVILYSWFLNHTHDIPSCASEQVAFFNGAASKSSDGGILYVQSKTLDIVIITSEIVSVSSLNSFKEEESVNQRRLCYIIGPADLVRVMEIL